MERGARAAVVTADAAGAAVAIGGGERFWIPAPRIADVRNPVGAGDVFACGLAAALERGEPVARGRPFWCRGGGGERRVADRGGAGCVASG